MCYISCIIPIFNVEMYLEECLKSIKTQSYNDYELICINDGSTDNSLEILKRYAEIDKRIKILNQANQGQGVARNLGMNAFKQPFLIMHNKTLGEKELQIS